MSDADRFNIYTQIHKGLRACMAETLALVGRLDPQDPADVMDAVAAVRSLLEFCRDHLAHEEQWLHPALEAARPGASAVTRREHEQHLASLARLDALTGALANAGDGQRRTAALQLYQQLALFVAENFEHMHGEETANHATLVAHYSEQEILALQGRLVASIAPEAMKMALRWMVPASSAPERAALFAGMQASAPPAAVTAMLEHVRPHLALRDWVKLGAAIGPMPQRADTPPAPRQAQQAVALAA